MLLENSIEPITLNQIRSLNQTLGNITIKDTVVCIKVISDNHPDMELAYRLWYEVYEEELKYNLLSGVNKKQQLDAQHAKGSIVFLALANGACVGTLKAAYSAYSELEFDYSRLLPGKKVGELSKLIAAKKFRKTELIAQILIACFDYNVSSGNYKLYDTIVINSTRKLLPYYTLFGFSKISNQSFVHPDIGNQCYLLQCSYETNEKVVNEMKKLLAGNRLVKIMWALKYWWYKNIKK